METIKAKLVFIMREEGRRFEPSINKMQAVDEINDFYSYGHAAHIMKPFIGKIVTILKFSNNIKEALIKLPNNRLTYVSTYHLEIVD